MLKVCEYMFRKSTQFACAVKYLNQVQAVLTEFS